MLTGLKAKDLFFDGRRDASTSCVPAYLSSILSICVSHIIYVPHYAVFPFVRERATTLSVWLVFLRKKVIKQEFPATWCMWRAKRSRGISFSLIMAVSWSGVTRSHSKKNYSPMLSLIQEVHYVLLNPIILFIHMAIV